MAPGLNSLGHDDVAAGLDGRFGLIRRSDLPTRQSTAFVGDLDVDGIRIAEMEITYTATLSGHRDGIALDEGHEEVHTERAVGGFRHRVEHRAHGVHGQSGCPEDTETTRVTHRGGERDV
jgi:hypothetical protein